MKLSAFMIFAVLCLPACSEQDQSTGSVPARAPTAVPVSIDDLVAATNYLPVDANLHFLIIGNMDSDKLHAQIAASHYSERIHLAGYRNDAPAVVASCDAMCLPSKKREGLPRSVIEAMSYGVAPIVTDTGGSKELVVDGKSGLVVESGNPKSIAAGIIRLYDDRELCERMGKSARERIANSFRIETTIDKTLELYESLLEDGRSS